MSINRASLLLVEDDVDLRTVLLLLLEDGGYNVREAADGMAALVQIEADLPDIIISDLNMPQMSGFELLAIVRRRFPAVSLIAMSGAFSGDRVPIGVTADAFFEKGTNPSLLLKALDSVALLKMVENMAQRPIATAMGV